MTWVDSLIRSRGCDPADPEQMKAYTEKELVRAHQATKRYLDSGDNALAEIFADHADELETLLKGLAEEETL